VISPNGAPLLDERCAALPGRPSDENKLESQPEGNTDERNQLRSQRGEMREGMGMREERGGACSPSESLPNFTGITGHISPGVHFCQMNILHSCSSGGVVLS
jgi:hypothetical protein